MRVLFVFGTPAGIKRLVNLMTRKVSRTNDPAGRLLLLLLLLLLLHRLCLLLLKELRLVVSFFALYEFVATAEQIVQGSAFELRHLALRFYWFRRFGFLGGEKSRSRLLLEIANRRGMRRNGYDYLVPACHVWRIDRKFSFFLAFAWHGRYGQGKLDVLDACGVCVRVVNVKMGVTRRKDVPVANMVAGSIFGIALLLASCCWNSCTWMGSGPADFIRSRNTPFNGFTLLSVRCVSDACHEKREDAERRTRVTHDDLVRLTQ